MFMFKAKETCSPIVCCLLCRNKRYWNVAVCILHRMYRW